jgi:protein SCO1/2
MLSFIKRYKFLILGFVLFSVLFLSIAYQFLNPKKTLPIYNPSMVNPELVDTTVQHISKYHTIADFSFTNQNGKNNY